MDLKKQAQWALDNIDSIKNKNILVVGDLGLDKYVDGSVDRISPEAPVPILRVHSRSSKLGLAGNVAANIASLGGQAQLLSLVGKDDASEELQQLFQDRSISTDGLISTLNRKTTCKTRLLSGHHHLLRFDEESTSPLIDNERSQLFTKIETAIQKADLVVLQDYGKGLIDRASAQFIIDQAKKHGLKVLVDPYSNSPLDWYKGAFLMTPNQKEAFELCRQKWNEEDPPTIEQQGQLLRNSIESENMVITLGSKGIKIFSKDSLFSVPTLARDVFDVTGAGDTVVSALALAIAAGWPLETAGFFANCAAGIVVGHVGALSCPIETVISEMKPLAQI